jgi:hypothetical protein
MYALLERRSFRLRLFLEGGFLQHSILCGVDVKSFKLS